MSDDRSPRDTDAPLTRRAALRRMARAAVALGAAAAAGLVTTACIPTQQPTDYSSTSSHPTSYRPSYYSHDFSYVSANQYTSHNYYGSLTGSSAYQSTHQYYSLG